MSAQEGFGCTLAATGFTLALTAVMPPEISVGDGIPATTLANTLVETFDVPQLLKTGEATFSADVTETSNTIQGLIDAKANLEWTYTLAGIVTCTFWGYAKNISIQEATSDSGTRHILSGAIFLTNKNGSDVETAPVWAAVV